MKRKLPITILVAASAVALWGAKPVIAPSYAWKMLPPLGLHEPATIDTTLYNYYLKSVPSAISEAYATTGNLGTEGMNMIYFDRKPMSDFFFMDALRPWIPTVETMKFYNTRIPMTLLSYNTGGGRENGQDRLKGTFSGNAGPRIQVGAMVDYIYSKGSYDYQAAKDLIWGASGSYMGERYELQAFYNHYNLLNKENGGITDDLYITDPAQLQGGQTSINAKAIPTRLTGAFSKIVGQQFFMNHRYKVGYYKEEWKDDTTSVRTYIPVSSFIWTFDYKGAKHIFLNQNAREGEEFWKHTYLNATGTDDRNSYWSIKNTLGVSLLEGFHKYAKAGLAAYASYEVRRYNQTTDTVPMIPGEESVLTPYPLKERVAASATQNLLWIGAQLTKQHGQLLTYDVTAELGVVGDVAGDIKVEGEAATRFRLLGDSVTVKAYGMFRNEAAPYLMQHYVSNHFIWDNDFGKTRRLRVGGILDIPHTRSRINVGVENVQNLIYFNSSCLPAQHGGSVQVFSARLEQDLKAGILHWNNRLTYQTSSDDAVIPLPKFAAYTNLFLLFKVARVLDVQFGIDCTYYTRYKSVAYQPATMSFYNQREVECGNYPFMNAYLNMKLSKVRFYLLFSHVNQGLTGNNYFSMPHYPLNPRKFQMGLSVDFAN
ncbi:MAG: putative porin [Pseudoflavonifractor sp.]|nr:putative porin [Pseudoflavonifractor sp.]